MKNNKKKETFSFTTGTTVNKFMNKRFHFSIQTSRGAAIRCATSPPHLHSLRVRTGRAPLGWRPLQG